MFPIYKLYSEIISIIIFLKFISGYGCKGKGRICNYIDTRTFEKYSKEVNIYK